MLFNNKLFNSIACLLSFTNLQLVIPGRAWILLYLGGTVYKRLWACLALYLLQTHVKTIQFLSGYVLFQTITSFSRSRVSMTIMMLTRALLCWILLKSSTRDHIWSQKGVTGTKHLHWVISWFISQLSCFYVSMYVKWWQKLVMKPFCMIIWFHVELGKVQKILPYAIRSENTFQKF